MENNENFVTEVTENVETTPTEESVVEQVETPAEKTYTQSELDEIVGKRLARSSAKIKKENDRKYGELVELLKVGTGKENVEDITDTFKKFYASKGMKLPEKPRYTDKEIEVLAKAEADEIISLGDDEVADEVDRLAEIGVENMNPRERAYFTALANHRQKTLHQNELAKIGVTDDVYNSKEFQDFVGKFNPTTPIADIYSIYNKTLPKKDIKPMGSMTNKTSDTGTVKDFYTRDEALQFTKKDFDNNPALYKAVEASMSKW